MTYATNRAALVAGALALLVAGIAIGVWTARRQPAAATDAAAPAQRQALYWFDPMVPDQHFDKPGKSPFMDMQLVPKYAGDAAQGGVRIDAGLRQNTGIRIEKVETGRLAPSLRVPGTLGWDMNLESVVGARADGVVTQVRVKAPYTRVTRGQPLATLLAPAWNSAVAEAQALQDAQSPAARDLRAAAARRLRALGVPGTGTNRDGSVTLVAPADGVVTEVTAREGQAVTPGMPLFRINGTRTVWLEAAIPPVDTSTLRAGTPVEAVVDAVPGRSFAGNVEALLPSVDATTRTQRARIVLRNDDGALAPGMFARVDLHPDAGAPLPLVPTQALVATGSDARVIVADDDGAFRPVRVRTGRSGGGRTEIREGLSGGENVVVSGQFLIDSEASLSGALERLAAPPADPSSQEPQP